MTPEISNAVRLRLHLWDHAQTRIVKKNEYTMSYTRNDSLLFYVVVTPRLPSDIPWEDPLVNYHSCDKHSSISQNTRTKHSYNCFSNNSHSQVFISQSTHKGLKVLFEIYNQLTLIYFAALQSNINKHV